jgi:putative membrane protein
MIDHIDNSSMRYGKIHGIKKIQHEAENRKARLFFTGLTMGLADLIPGVSGGTIAFLLGIYDELLYTIKLMTGQVPKLILARKFKQAYSLIPFGFLIPLFGGIALAIFGLAQVVSFLLETHPVAVWSLFFGLVLGSAFVVSRRITKWTVRRSLSMLLGFVVTFVVVGLPSVGGSNSPLAILGTGAIAITAMILPGISGSLIMVLLGQYKVIIDAVANRDFAILAIFAAGAILGLALFVRILTWLLKHYHMSVIAFLVGVLAGSLRRIWPWQNIDANNNMTNILPSIDGQFLWAVLLTVAGFMIVIILERVGIAKEHDDINTQDFKKEFKEIEG